MDEDGHCLENCTYDSMCRYTGTLKFENRTCPAGGGARLVFDDDDNPLNGGNPVPLGGKLTGLPVNIKSPCGASGDAAPKFYATDGGGNITSMYMFYCTVCS
jgi:hypothetical protein